MVKGKLHIITGCMFSEKSLEMVERVNALEQEGHGYICFSPLKDFIFSRAVDIKVPAILVDKEKPLDILFQVGLETTNNSNLKDIFIDEIQFYDDSILEVVQVLLDKGYTIYAAGLDKNFKNEVFGVMGELLGLAFTVKKKHTTCAKCGNNDAHCSQRMLNGEPAPMDSPTIVIDKSADEKQEEYYYEPRCLTCYNTK